MNFFCRAACAVCIALPSAANADAPPLSKLPPEASHPAVRAAWSACNADIIEFCSTVVPGGGRIVRCLADNREELSIGCLDGMLKAKAALGR
jgi:hypothetical protein